MVVSLASRAIVEIDGQELQGSVAALMEEVVVDDDLYLPDMFEIRISDPRGTTIADTGVRIGSRCRVSATTIDDASPRPLISGEVTALEGEYDASGSRLVIRGYDHAHRLMRGRRTATYNQVTDGDIAGQVADRAGLGRGTIDDPGMVHEQVSQANQSEWEFLSDRARAIDYRVSVEDGKLSFVKPRHAASAPGEGGYESADPLQLVFGKDLLEFRPRVTAAGQVASVEVRGWSVANKAAIVGHAEAGTTAASLTDDPASLSGLFGSHAFVAVDAGPRDGPSADATAARLAEALGSPFVEATGVARGDPRLRAGAAISVSLVAAPFVGRYLLTSTRHMFDLASGYRTRLAISGRQERSLMRLTSGGSGGSVGTVGHAGSGSERLPGVVTAIVDDIADPQGYGRVRLMFPWLSGDYVSGWARVSMPGAGANRGLVWLPEHGDEVLVAFEQGDIQRPIVLGGLWNGKDAVPGDRPDQGNRDVRAFVSRTGHALTITESSDTSKIEIVSADGTLHVTLDQTNGQLTLEAGAGKNLSLKAGGDIRIESQGSLSLSGQTQAELKSSGQTSVKGTLVAIN